MEKLLKEVEELNSNTPDGVIRDADTIIIDANSEKCFEITGIADVFLIFGKIVLIRGSWAIVLWIYRYGI